VVVSTEAQDAAVRTRFSHADQRERHANVELRRARSNDEFLSCNVTQEVVSMCLDLQRQLHIAVDRQRQGFQSGRTLYVGRGLGTVA